MLLFLRLYSVTFATWGTSLSSTVRLGSQCQIPTVRRLRDQLHEVQDTVSLTLNIPRKMHSKTAKKEYMRGF
jgi:hypothetical protein